MNRKNKPVRMTLAHINDTHSYFEPQSLQLNLDIDGEKISPYVSNGGFARIATRAKQIKLQAQQSGRKFMFFHGGDCFQGTLYFSLFKGEANAEMLNALKIDAMALGNHELDMGNEPVAEFLGRINFPLLSGNWNISEESESKKVRLDDKSNLISYNAVEKRADWIVKHVNGEPVAVFGLSIDKMAEIANADPDTPFMNTIETARQTVKAMHQQGINKIILLSHNGYELDQELAKAVEGISLIIGAHSHTLQGDFSSLGMNTEDEYGTKVNGTHIVQAGLHSQSIGHCDIDFDEDGNVVHFAGKNELLIGRRLCIDASLQEVHQDCTHEKAHHYLAQHENVVICKRDPHVHSLLEDKYIPRVRELQASKIGEVNRTLRHVRVPDHMGGSEIAPLVAESFMHKMNALGHQIEFAIHNAGGVRTSLNPGPISVADIAGKLLPFAVPIGVYRIKGKYIATALEGAINNATNNGVIGTGSGSYPYAYNLDYIYKPENPAGSRIINLKIYQDGLGWAEVEPEKLYSGTSSAYTMKGKEGYEGLTEMQGSGTVTHYSMADCFIDFVRHYPEKLGSWASFAGDIG
ncbi:bifunctional metallophosphatase/5'-nucleotidase [Vibrio sp. JC009]|uniref:bifunctional metallophosphatase/5'-nucleotidase n=1 Tax=Vibrio sp. JC009 TaxID=2912314 RepID=UPI0023AFFBF7|nr:bifunctional UDP-sugar hydrolase/5'-nucleotidase [Vibrio sp. JC009]WED24425.1 bifunctional metallophosphatase/5'-nucleotidase [Vibrio sp. JC009]